MIYGRWIYWFESNGLTSRYLEESFVYTAQKYYILVDNIHPILTAFFNGSRDNIL